MKDRAVIRAVCISERKGEQKHPVETIHLRPEHGIEGDAHAGNWHRQVSLLAQESVDGMQARTAVPLGPGVFAENIRCEGIALRELPIGTRLAGDCVMPREGIFAIVISEGDAKAGDLITVLENGTRALH